MIDLHTHSRVSDGSDPPAEVMERAAAAQCQAIALTDHESLDGIPEAQARAEALGIEFVPGTEVSCSVPEGGMHLLCYFIEPGEGPMQDSLAHMQNERELRNHLLTQRLNELGMRLEHDEVVAEAGGSGVGRPHYAAVMVKHGYVESMDQAFEMWLGEGQPAHFEKAAPTPAEIIDLAKKSGGVVALAHPTTLGLEGSDLESAFRELAGLGMTGVECIYGRYTPEERDDYAAMTRRAGLVVTGGSDYHGSYKPDLSVGTGIGDLRVPYEVLEELRGRRPG